MRFTVVLVLLAVAQPVHAGVGVFTETTGEVRIQRAENWLAAAPGVNVEADDIIETGADSATQLDMRDGSVFKLGANTRLLLSEYNLDHDGSVLTAGLNVLSGWMRFAVAKLRNTERRYDINMPTMTVGIRGTEGVLEARNEGGGLLMETGEVQVHSPGASRTTVRAGQYVEPRPGVTQFRPGAPPEMFRARLPGAVQARAERRAHLLKARDVAPRRLRAVTREDHERLRREHPHQRKNFEQRFEKHAPLQAGGRNAGKPPRPAEARPPQARPPHEQPLKPPPKQMSPTHDKHSPEKRHKKDPADDKKPDRKKPEQRDKDERRSAVTAVQAT